MRPSDPLVTALSSFIAATGARRGGLVKLGAGAPAAEPVPTPEQRAALLAGLAAAGRSSRAIVGLWVALILMSFGLAMGLAIYHRDDLAFVAGAVLGGSGVMAALLAQVRRLHTRQVSTQILLALLPNLPPQAWVKAATALLDEVVKAPAD